MSVGQHVSGGQGRIGAVVPLGHPPLAPAGWLHAFYRGPSGRDALMYAYLDQDLTAGHHCLCLVSGVDPETVRSELNARHPGLDLDRLDTGEPSTELAANATAAAPPVREVIDGWARRICDGHDRSFLTLVADVTCALPIGGLPFADFLEALAHVADRPLCHLRTCLRMYDIDRLAGNDILTVVRNHSKVLMNGIVVENPYFLSPAWQSATAGLSDQETA